MVDDLELEDLIRLEDDKLYNVGMQVVQQILYEMAVIGRSKRAGPTRRKPQFRLRPLLPPHEAAGRQRQT